MPQEGTTMSVFWDDLAHALQGPEFEAAYAEASALIRALDGIANASEDERQ
jgi:hypothetical protein